MPDTAINLKFGEGEYRFAFPLPQAVELERKTGKSIFAIFDSIQSGLGLDNEDNPHYVGGSTATVTDIREVIRLGLIGGDMSFIDGVEEPVGPMRASSLISDYVFPARPLAESLNIAWYILRASIHGIGLKKKDEPINEEAGPIS